MVDILDLGGTPGYRFWKLLNWCAQSSKAWKVVARWRSEEWEIADIDTTSAKSRGTFLKEEQKQLLSQKEVFRGAQNTQSAFLARVGLSIQSCESEMLDTPDNSVFAEFRWEALMGGAHSCPVTLGQLEGKVFLDLGTSSDPYCENSAIVCAAADPNTVPTFMASNMCTASE